MLRITGGTVYDPANGIDGVVKDLCIADGRIVAEAALPAGARTIDASGMVVMPGGVDVHTHVAGGALNFARGLVPENQRAARKFLHGLDRRAGLGGMTPTTFATGYLYAGMGWTTVNEAAVPILSARHTHEELHDIPIVDKTSLVLMANNEFVLDLLEAGEIERARQVVAWLVWAAKAYGLKAVNPGGVEAWKWGKNANTLHAPIEGYKTVTPAQIIASLAGMADDLGLPHPVHLHCNNLGVPGNFATTIETMSVLQGHRAHLAHLQFHAYGGDDWSTMRSESARVAEAFSAQKNLTTDAGAVLFGDAVTITADGPWQHLLYQLTGRKWGNLDVENETGCGIVPYVYKDRNLVNAVQWAVGLELLLLIDDPWRIFLTTDHPNGGGFWRYPEIIHMLMNGEFRKEQCRSCPKKRGGGSCSRISIANTRCRRSRSSRRRARPGRSASPRRGTWAWAPTPTSRSIPSGPITDSSSRTRATCSRAAPSWSRRATCATSSTAGSSSCIRRAMMRSKSTFARSSRRSTRCRLRTTRWKWNDFVTPK